MVIGARGGSTMIDCEIVALFPDGSVAVKTTGVVPTGNRYGASTTTFPIVALTVTEPELSVARGKTSVQMPPEGFVAVT